MNNKEILITGGTGTLGSKIVEKLLTVYEVKGIRIFSRDEFKQSEMKKKLQADGLLKNVAFLIGDVADYDRVALASKGVDIIIHTAAMKHVSACEENPIEAVKTNIHGAINIVRAALANKVEKVMNISTDKAVYPVNLYGMTKGTVEKIFAYANVYSGFRNPIFSTCRYGNVIGSRGSVIPLFKKQFENTGIVTVTDTRMTRFWISIDQVVNFILMRLQTMTGGEIFVPYMKTLPLLKLVEILTPEAEIKTIDAKIGEKLHEILVTEEECHFTERDELGFIIRPNAMNGYDERSYSYTSQNCEEWNPKDFRKVLNEQGM